MLLKSIKIKAAAMAAVAMMAICPVAAIGAEIDPGEAPETSAVTSIETETETNKEADSEAVKAFVSRLYKNYLGREADEDGLKAWTDALVSGRGTGAKVVYGFVYSPEFQANPLSNSDFVAAMYRTIFDREPDETGLQAWVYVLDNGCTRKKVLSGFLNSHEMKDLCDSLGIAAGTYSSEEIVDQNPKVTYFVSRMYRCCLGREADAAGLEAWVSALLDGRASGTRIATGFFFSPEMEQMGLDDEAYVTNAYKALLDREPDQDGFASWVKALENNNDRTKIVYGFVKSQEFANLCAEYGITQYIEGDIPTDNTTEANDPTYILPDSDINMYFWQKPEGYYSTHKLGALSDRELKLAKNEMYARRGYIFSDAELAEYFSNKTWYKPSVPAEEFDENVFNEVEKFNLQNMTLEEEERAKERATLSEGELLVAEINRFLNSRPTNGFLWSSFNEPGADVKMVEVVYQVGAVGIDTDTFYKEFEKQEEEQVGDISYITSAYLDELLKRLTGYGLHDKEWNLKDVPYLSAIDTYYVEHGDSNFMGVVVKEVKDLGDGIYEASAAHMRFEGDGYDDEIAWVVRVKRIEAGGYQLLSVQRKEATEE